MSTRHASHPRLRIPFKPVMPALATTVLHARVLSATPTVTTTASEANGRTRWPSPVRVLLFLVLTLGLWASVGHASTLADTLSVSLSNPSPPDGAPITVAFTANAAATDSYGDGPYLYAVVQPSSAGACGATYGADTQVVGSQATTISNTSFNNNTQLATGQSTTTFSFTAYSAGQYTICAWVETVGDDYSNAGYTPSVVTATTTATVTYADTDTLTIGASTQSPAPKVPFTVTFSGQADAIDSNGDGPYLYAVIQPSSAGGCGATYGGDVQVAGAQATTLSGEYGNSSTEVVTGGYSTQMSVTEPRGTYVVCGWLESVSGDGSNSGYTPSVVLATTGPTTYTVGAVAAGTPPAPVKPLSERIRARLQIALRSLARTAGSHRLEAQAPCATIVFHAPSAGKLTVGYYQSHRHGGTLLICSGTTTFTKAGAGTMTVGLSPASYVRRVVARGRSFNAVIYIRFRPRHGKLVVLKRTVRMS